MMFTHTRCPTKKHNQCHVLQYIGVVVLVACAMAVLVYPLGLGTTKIYTNIAVTVIGTVSVLWSMWVLRTFMDMMQWWKNIILQLDTTSQLLTETKKELSEIKFISVPQRRARQTKKQ